METLFCDAIGCENPPAYVCLFDPSGMVEEYLCLRCYQSLKNRHRSATDRYASLDSLPRLAAPLRSREPSSAP